MDGGAWWTAVHGVAKSQTRLSDFTFTFKDTVKNRADMSMPTRVNYMNRYSKQFTPHVET